MIIVGERINTFKKSVMRAYEQKDEEYIRNEVKTQAEAGSHVIDINAGSDLTVEPKNMQWAVKIAQEVTDLPLAIDSPNPETIIAGFEVRKNKHDAWINSINLQEKRLEKLLPLAKEHDCPVVALCMDEAGVAQSAEKRVEFGKRIVEKLDTFGISLEKLYLDPMIEPLSVRGDAGLMSLHTLQGLKKELPEVKTIISLSGISFGLPQRKLLHRMYMGMLMYEKLDSVFLDPLDEKLMTGVMAAEALLNQDEFCMNYIAASREDKLIV